jgi:hypothetical protein
MTEAAEGRAALQVNAVVYGTDFTVCSQNAGLYAALMARFFSAKLLWEPMAGAGSSGESLARLRNKFFGPASGPR